MAESQLPGLPGFNPHNIQPWTVSVVVSVTILALLSVALRVVSRRIKKQPLWWDDWMIVFSMGWNLVVVGFIFAMHGCGMGIHADLVEPAKVVMMAKWLVVAEILYAFNLAWTKLSLLLMYNRIFGAGVPSFRPMSIAIGSFVMVWAFTITFLFIFICVPVQKMWYPELPGKCINQVATWIANAASTILTDLLILFMPLPPLWGLKLGKREKIGLTAAFGLGSFVVFASAYRTSVLFTYTATDPSYTLAPTVGWTAIEMAAGIISANLPTMLPALNVFLRSLGIRSKNGTSRSGSSIPFRSTKDHRSTPSQADIDGAVLPPTGKRASNSVFYRLPDENSSSGSAEVKGYQYTVKSMPSGERGEESSDEIPLHGIRVEKDTYQESSNVSPFKG